MLDLLVSGAGLAGLSAANRAIDLGLRVAVLEASPEAGHANASRVNPGCIHVAFNGVDKPRDVLSSAIINITQGFVPPELARLIGDNALRAVQWLQSAGVELTQIPPYNEWKQFVLAPYGGFQENTTFIWKGWGPDRALSHLENRLLQKGGNIFRGSKLAELIHEGGVISGAVTQRGSEKSVVHCRNVLISDGGFEGNLQMLRKYVSPNPENVQLRGVPSAKGDGIRLASAVGANLVGMEGFYGHVLSADSLKREGLSPFPFLSFLASSGMMIDARGERFVDETKGGHYVSNILARHDSGIAHVIFDDAMWKGTGTHFLCPPNPNLLTAGGTLHQADSIWKLAELIKVRPALLEKQIADHNSRVVKSRAFSSGSEAASPFSQGKYKSEEFYGPPYYAAPACAAITYTFGGIQINHRAQALRASGDPISGLWAAGSACGGLEGGPEVGYIGGLIKALVLGVKAAEGCAEGVIR